VSKAGETPACRPTAVLHALLANSTDAIVTVDSEGRIRFTSLGASHLLGYDNAATIGTSIFAYLHADDVHAAGQLFGQRLGYDGSDTGHERRLHHCRGNWVTVRSTASLLPTSGLGVISVAIAPVEDVNQTEESLRRQLTVQELSFDLGGRFIEAETSSEVLDHLRKSLSDIGLLTGADAVSVFVERTDRGVLERLARWTTVSKAHVPGRRELAMSLDSETAERILHEPFVLEGGATDVGRGSRISGHLPAVASIMSAPFDTGNQRGVLVVMRFEPGPKWLDTDAQLSRNTAQLLGSALRIARTEKLLSLIYLGGPIGFSIRTWAGEFIDSNDQYLHLVGLERGKAKSQTLQDVADPKDQAFIVKGLQRLKRGEIDKLSGESWIVLPDLTTRWNHPERGLITASYFIDVAEQTGLIDEIGRFALREACRAFMFIAKQTDGDRAADLKLRVNISGREFARPELGGLVQAALDNSGLAPDRLCLEMTETTLMDSAEIALHTFEGLHELGVQFAIDDFVTLYRSRTSQASSRPKFAASQGS